LNPRLLGPDGTEIASTSELDRRKTPMLLDVTSHRAARNGEHMIDKHRHRHLAPHGSVPNWVLCVLAAFAFVVASCAGSIV
jgi:hypothetical protein